MQVWSGAGHGCLADLCIARGAQLDYVSDACVAVAKSKVGKRCGVAPGRFVWQFH